MKDKVIDYIGSLTYNVEADCWKTIREYLIRCNFHTSLKLNAKPYFEDWYIGKDGAFPNRDALEQWEISNYEQEKYAIATEFSKYCLKHVILKANEDTFEQFLDFDISPYKSDCHPEDIIEYFRQDYYSWEKFFDKFFQYGYKTNEV